MAKTEEKTSPVLEKLKAHRAATDGVDTFVLEETGVAVTVPMFKPYAAWQKAQRVAGKDQGSLQVYYILELCTFDGERLTFGDYRELIPSPDHIKIVGEVFGAREADEGNADGPAPSTTST